MIMTILQYLTLIYIFLKTVNTYSEIRLCTMIIYMSYMFSGFTSMVYTIFVMMIVKYSKHIPMIIGTINTKYIDKRINTTTLTKVNDVLIEYNLQNIVKYYLVIGDVICNSMCAILINISNKIKEINPKYNEISKHINTMNTLTDTENIDDYIENNDEQHIQQLNDDLDNLLKMGTEILTQTIAGKKSEQEHRVNKFMNDAGKLFKNKKGK